MEVWEIRYKYFPAVPPGMHRYAKPLFPSKHPKHVERITKREFKAFTFLSPLYLFSGPTFGRRQRRRISWGRPEDLNASGCQQRLLSEVSNFPVEPGTQIFATPQFNPEIMENFQELLPLEIRASEDDVRRYLSGHIFKLTMLDGFSVDLWEEFKTGIIKAVDEMQIDSHALSESADFTRSLLAQLHLDSLFRTRSS